jgi:acyl-CoA synthetase (AMP-forming)/AMP-acid ligase II
MLAHRTVLERHASWSPDRPALTVPATGEQLTYREFDERVNQLANGFRERGVRKGDRVGFVLYNTIEFPIAVYACYKIGAVPAPVNYMLAPGDFEYIFAYVNPELVVYDAKTAEAVEAAADAAPSPPHMVIANGDSAAADGFDDVLDASSAVAPPELTLQPDEPAYILFTSGTTGKPKGVVFSAETAHHRRQETVMLTGMGPETVSLQLSPWFHAGGMANVIHPVVAVGGEIIVTDDFDPTNALDVIDDRNVTYVVSVPKVSLEIASHEDVDSYDRSSLECWLAMGSPLTKTAAERLIEQLTPNLYNGYGLTESVIDVTLRPSDLPEHAGKTGKPNVDKEVRVIEYDRNTVVQPDETVPIGESGEVIVRGPTLFDQYFERAETTREAFTDGWFYTGDLGVIDEDGYLTVTGRADDMVVSGGELVSPVEVEEVIERHPAVQGAIVVGVEDEEWGERVTAYVVAPDVSAEDLDSYCKDSGDLADYKRPKDYEFVESLKRTETGKKQRYKYRE